MSVDTSSEQFVLEHSKLVELARQRALPEDKLALNTVSDAPGQTSPGLRSRQIPNPIAARSFSMRPKLAPAKPRLFVLAARE